MPRRRRNPESGFQEILFQRELVPRVDRKPTKGVDLNLRESSIHFGMFHGFEVRQFRLLRGISVPSRGEVISRRS
jgi:hypothetical protein